MQQDQRPSYYEGQYLEAVDLDAAVLYSRVQAARRALGAHTWGIAVGLELVERALPDGTVDVSLTPGVAWDGYGRAVVVTAPTRIGPGLFSASQADTPDDGALVKVWLRYAETATRAPAPGFETCRGEAYARVAEGFAVVVGEPRSGAHGTVSVAGRDLDPGEALRRFDASAPPLYDASVPFQQFPETDAPPRWLIPIGMVRWFKQGTQAGAFLPRDDSGGSDGTQPRDSDATRAFRRYLGTVGESFQAADGVIRLRDRDDDPAAVQPKPNADGDLVWVEGHLRVLGDARLVHGRLDLRDPNGGNDGVPHALRRRANGTGGKDLQVVYAPAGGDAPTGKHAFVVGIAEVDGLGAPKDAVTAQFVVRDDGGIGAGTSKPVARFQVAGDLALEKTDSGVARALPDKATLMWNDGTWLRLNQNLDFGKPVFGVHTPGLFTSGSLNVGGLADWGDPGAGSAWIAGTLGVGTTSQEARLVVDSQGAQGRLMFFRASGDIEYDGGDDHLFVFRNQGDTTAFVGGDVGIGTTAPQAQLHVADDLRADGRITGNGGLTVSGGTHVSGSTMIDGPTMINGATSINGPVALDGAVYCSGNVTMQQSLNVTHDLYVSGSKHFLIPHPLASSDAVLVHASLEGPEAGVYYRGEGRLRDGRATVVLPSYFEALTRADQRSVLLTPICDGDDPVSPLAATPVRDGRFGVRMIGTDNPCQRFFWEVKAIRADVPRHAAERPAVSAHAPPSSGDHGD
jgi:hypothetical protein